MGFVKRDISLSLSYSGAVGDFVFCGLVRHGIALTLTPPAPGWFVTSIRLGTKGGRERCAVVQNNDVGCRICCEKTVTMGVPMTKGPAYLLGG